MGVSSEGEKKPQAANRSGRSSKTMKCQQCSRPATFHITELTDEGILELHLCQEHAAEYLMQAGPGNSPPKSSMAGALAQHLQVSQTGEELARLDENACPVCGITFYEFRQHGRLGCPHDYVAFAEQLEPLLVSIHGESHHIGKHPKHHAGATEDQATLIRLRRELQDAVEREAYEEASELRDKIRELEEAGRRPEKTGEDEL